MQFVHTASGAGPRPKSAAWAPGRIARWAPFAVLLDWVGGRGVGGRLGFDLTLLWAGGGLWLAWLAGRGLWPLVAVFSLALLPLAWQAGISGPAALEELRRLPPGSYLRLEGTVRAEDMQRRDGGPSLWLLLGEARVMADGREWRLLQVAVRFGARSSRRPRLYRRRVRVGGVLTRVSAQNGTLLLSDASFHRQVDPVHPRSGERLRAALGARAAYYLGKPALAVYRPIILGVRQRGSPEAWEVARTANRVGISHLFAISGLHIGLLFLIFLAVVHFGLGFVLPSQGWLRARTLARVGVTGVIWGYIALIGFPIPAVRAATMGTMLVWADLWGTRTPALYVLLLAGLGLLLLTPTALYDLSFQLSFLGYFFLVCGLGLSRTATAWISGGARVSGFRSLLGRWFWLVGMNLWITLWITLGVWPLIALRFGNLSLLVFIGNLVMIPLLSVAVLPVGLLALCVSLFFVGSVPGGWVERFVFAGLEAVLQGWLWLVEAIDRVGSPLVFAVRLRWDTREIFLYYVFLLGFLFLLGRLLEARSARNSALPGGGR
ncbi:MAG: ComEC/Rec2 family competence protein [bacterium]